ncbi:gsr2624 [Gloeobacter violaceus PCC 7421]|uniref:Gsr2624 protein n=1 Tax=Gloeobacter violaceus (strain ATCC 29082 / PCC 7421) TaxID=251221 RepID=Q7NHB3_GLOVI|nr:gsr2624 [Gloeobacter violaceus PCC 7421]
MLLRMGAQQPVNFLNQADRVDDSSDDAEVVEIVDLDFSRRLAHPTKILQPLYLPAESRIHEKTSPFINIKSKSCSPVL